MEYQEKTDDTETRRVELYLRSLAPCGGRNEQDAIIRRLLDLERRDVLNDVDLTVWGNAVCLDATSARVGDGVRIAERIQAFHDWCEDRRASLEPFFTWSTVESSIADDSFHRVVPPHRLLAIYVGDQLEEVYPRNVEGKTYSLTEGLRSLEQRRSHVLGQSVVSGEMG